MAAPKLQPEQQSVLLTWLAAEYSEGLIFKWFADRDWPQLTSQALNYYRKRHAAAIEAAREARRSAAINSGLALREERVERLKDHADELEAIKWLPDEKGRLWNEKAWRETLDDIAKEMGHRKSGDGSSNTQPNISIQVNAIDYRTAIAVLAPPADGSVVDLDASGEGQGAGNGPALGQEHNGRRLLPGDSEPGG